MKLFGSYFANFRDFPRKLQHFRWNVESYKEDLECSFHFRNFRSRVKQIDCILQFTNEISLEGYTLYQASLHVLDFLTPHYFRQILSQIKKWFAIECRKLFMCTLVLPYYVL